MTIRQGENLHNPDYLCQVLDQRSSSWWVGGQPPHLLTLVSERLAALTPWFIQPTVLLAEPDPTAFLAGFLAATAARCPVVLGNPGWSEAEWQQVWSCIRPDLIWGKVPSASAKPSHPPAAQPLAPGWILIPTGGSSGQIRFAIHTWETLSAAVLGFQTYFEVEQINSCCLLPLYHVSGLMQVMRSWQTGGRLVILPFKAVRSGCGAESAELAQFDLAQFDPAQFFLSLVPTQLQKLLQDPDRAAWLRQFQTVFLGGAPAWDSLLSEARQQKIRLAPTYGMTETAAQIATLKPEAFLQGEAGCGSVLPHARVEILPVQASGRQTDPISSEIGQISIRASSLMLGYFPRSDSEPVLGPLDQFLTDDLGDLNHQGQLQIVGRSSGKIITGGENVFPAELEAAIRATGLVSDVYVLGLPDAIWGEAVVAVCVAADWPDDLAESAIQAALAPRLSRYKLPKRWIWVEQLPRNAQGKLNSAQIQQQIRQFLASGQTHTRPRQPAKWSADAALEKPPNWQ